jgi:excisionase family DNA binding protein
MTPDGDATHEYLTVRELAGLLRIKERKVYDLAASGEVPCTRVTGKLLFPEAAIRAWMAGASSGLHVSAARPAVLLGSYDPLLEWSLRQSRCGLATFLDGSLDGLDRFVAREGVATGLHVADAASGTWNVAAVVERGVPEAVLVAWATRRRGLVLREGDAAEVRDMAGLAGRRVVPRQAESGTHLLFERLLAEAGMATSDLTLTAAARSEADAVSTVAQGDADAAFGLEAVAAVHRLRFVPMVEERFDLLVDRRAWFERPMQRLLAFCRTSEFRAHASTMPGYDVSEAFEVRWNA